MDDVRHVAAQMGLFGEGVDDAIRAAMRGEGGEAMMASMRMKLAGHVKTGRTLRDLSLQEKGKQISIGVQGGRRDIGAYLESGTGGHIIRAKKGSALLVAGGHPVKMVIHGGSRRFRVAAKTLRETQWEVESSIVDEFEKLAHRTGGH